MRERMNEFERIDGSYPSFGSKNFKKDIWMKKRDYQSILAHHFAFCQIGRRQGRMDGAYMRGRFLC